jgi:small GTP-binding protein
MLRRILDEKRRELLREVRSQLGELRVVVVRLEASEEDQKTLARSIAQLDELFLLVVVGEFNAGKSAVLNALVGERVLEEGVTPTTSRIALVRYGAERTRTPAGGGYEDVTLPVELLREMSVVDTPGTNAVLRGHEALTRDFVPRSDLVLFVTSADRPFTESERAFLEAIRAWGKKIVVAVNKVDILEKPEDIRTVTEFVRDKMRELLSLQPEIFAVSARNAQKAKAAGLTPDPGPSGFAALEAYLTRTLDSPERLRLKLLNPLGVASRVLDATAAALKERRTVISGDTATLTEIEGQLAHDRKEALSDLRLRAAEAERPLQDLERRGEDFLDRRLRLGGILDLAGRERTRAAFEREVGSGLPALVEKRAEGLVDALVAGELRLLPAVAERVKRRAALHTEKVPGLVPRIPVPDRARIVAALRRELARVLEGYDIRDEARRVAGAARRAAAGAFLLLAGAIGTGTLAVLWATSSDRRVVLLVLAAVLAAAGLALLPALRGRERARLGKRVSELRERLASALRASVEREIDATQRRATEAIAPYARFVRAEAERLRLQHEDLTALEKRIEALRARIESLR